MKDCAIVCGYPTNDDGSLSAILESRIQKAVDLYRQKQVKYILVSGGAIHNRFCEAEAMKQYALLNGVNENDIIVENQAKSTYHNMYYADLLMKQYHLSSCYVITNSWHMIKAKYYAEKFHLNYESMKCKKPKGMSYLKVVILHIYMPINMLINRWKGFK